MFKTDKKSALRLEETKNTNEFTVAGRGELHLAILIETMRRELYEFSVSKPEVIYQKTPQGLHEPIEHVLAPKWRSINIACSNARRISMPIWK